MTVKISKLKNVKLKEREKQVSKYADIIESVKKLKMHEVCLLSVPKGTSLETYRNRVWAALRRTGMLESKKYVSRITESKEIAIYRKK